MKGIPEKELYSLLNSSSPITFLLYLFIVNQLLMNWALAYILLITGPCVCICIKKDFIYYQSISQYSSICKHRFTEACTNFLLLADSTEYPVIVWKAVGLTMIWSRLGRRIHLSPYFRTLQNASPESRCLSIVSEVSSYKSISCNIGFQHFFTSTRQLSKLDQELSTKSFHQCFHSLASASQNVRSSGATSGVRHFSSHASKEKKSQKMLLYLTGLVFGMVGVTYAAVPLYRRFCQATGYGGTVQRRETVEEKIARHDKEKTVATREIVVQFNADIADGMPWKFIPTQREVRVKPGESALAFYTAENKSSTPITGVSTYNVTPMKAAVYFNKIQCFCFEEQRLLPGEQIDMPVFFYIDPEIETDPRMDGVNNIILSYTFFKVSEE